MHGRQAAASTQHQACTTGNDAGGNTAQAPVCSCSPPATTGLPAVVQPIAICASPPHKGLSTGSDGAAAAARVGARVGALAAKVESVLAGRTECLLLVLDRCTDNDNYMACLRTADVLGIQDVWIITAPLPAGHVGSSGKQGGAHDAAAQQQGRKKGRITRRAAQWLDVRVFVGSAECIAALRADGRSIWATDLSADSQPLTSPGSGAALLPPERLAIVMGREADGVSDEVLAAADRRVHLPMRGWSDSLNVSVATALVCQQLLAGMPAAHGGLPRERRAQLRRAWYATLARSQHEQDLFAAWALQHELG